MKMSRVLLSGIASVLTFAGATQMANAVAPDECEQQRAVYPKDWNDVSRERPLFICTSHYSGSLRISVGATDRGGRTLMSIVPLKRAGEEVAQDSTKDVYRIWLDREQLRRLRAGRYFATIVRQQTSCWIRGSLSTDKDESDSVFLMDNAGDHPDGLREGTGSFYNKAPRFSVFRGDAYTCTGVK
jgi:hypothetical protein